MTDNRTTKFLKDYAFALRRLEYDADKPGSNMTLGEYEAEEKRITDKYAQAIAATLGGGECENIAKYWGEFECSECDTWADFGSDLHLVSYCPHCGKKVKR